MTMPDTYRDVPTVPAEARIQWGPVFAGALAAAALASVLHAFAGAIGLAVSSTSPTWRDGSVALWLLSGIYLLLAALAAYGLGGYVAGRTQRKVAAVDATEIETRDGAHGLLAWALATLITMLLAGAMVTAAVRLAAPSGGQPGPAASVGGENIIAYDLDKLFRADRRPANFDLSYPRSEAARILLTASGHSGVAADDRAYLTRLVSATTGAPAAEAQQRVETAIANARTNISRARRSAVLIAFMTGAAALFGAAAAWFAACTGGRHRDGVAPDMTWPPRSVPASQVP